MIKNYTVVSKLSMRVATSEAGKDPMGANGDKDSNSTNNTQVLVFYNLEIKTHKLYLDITLVF